MSGNPSDEIGVDIGGTFTDVVLLRDLSELHRTKVPSTPGDPVAGVMTGVDEILRIADGRPQDVTRFVHGSTVAINALLERKGAKTGILMTRGFEDTLEIGRQKRLRMYDLYVEAETPVFLAPRRRRFGVTERVGPNGEVITELDLEDVREAVRILVDRHDVSAVSVCYLFSFRNPSHEVATRELIAKEFPGIEVSISSDVDPHFREYERLVATTLDAYLRGTVASYVARLRDALGDRGISAPLQVMQSRGGITGAATVARQPLSMLLSGLAAGVVGGRFAAASAGYDDVVTLDIGGTSCDVALVEDGKAFVSNVAQVEKLLLRQQMIDVNTIGAGGGSVAWIDDVGGLRVGPHSMGSDPGPACYGRGGNEATVTDASVVLGYLNPDNFAGGGLKLDREAAQSAVDRIAQALGMDRAAAAAGIHRILNARMVDEIRRVTIQRGRDPRDFSLVALGGAGPVHATALLAELGMKRVIVPETPGVLSAFGLLVADTEHDQSETFAAVSGTLDDATLEDRFGQLDARCAELMAQDGFKAGSVQCSRHADMRYVGQSYEIAVTLPDRREDLVVGTVARFHELHQALYGHASPDTAVEFVNLRVVHRHPTSKPDLAGGPEAEAALPLAAGTRPVHFGGGEDYVTTPIYDRQELLPGVALAGPLVVEQADTTLVVHPGQRLVVDRGRNIIVEAERHES